MYNVVAKIVSIESSWTGKAYKYEVLKYTLPDGISLPLTIEDEPYGAAITVEPEVGDTIGLKIETYHSLLGASFCISKRFYLLKEGAV